MALPWQPFFELNAVLVNFGYGLVFFVLGLAIALQSRYRSRLELARALGWLAAFGLAHGFYEWGSVFIPLQAVYLEVEEIAFLRSLHTALLALSFAFLFQFGVEMLRQRWPTLAAVPLVITTVWALLFFMPGVLVSPANPGWPVQANIWARYLIGFPAALCAAAGLKFQANKTIRPMQLGGIYTTLRAAEMALVAYALLGGLVVPRAPFFPASFINEFQLMVWTGVPVAVFRSATGLILALAIIRALEVFDLEVDLQLEEMEMERNLALERDRIGRELHDSTLQTIYSAGLLIEAARQKLPDHDPNSQQLERSLGVLDEAVSGLRAYIDGLCPETPEQGLEQAIRAAASDSRWNSLLKIRLDLDLPPDASFGATRTQQVRMILNEALSNTARHAKSLPAASRSVGLLAGETGYTGPPPGSSQAGPPTVKISAAVEGGQLKLVVADDGQGFEQPENSRGYGLRNMRDRTRSLGGDLRVESAPGRGTSVLLTAPWEVEE